MLMWPYLPEMENEFPGPLLAAAPKTVLRHYGPAPPHPSAPPTRPPQLPPPLPTPDKQDDKNLSNLIGRGS